MVNELLVTVDEAARRLGMGRSYTYQLVLRGDIESVKLGRSRRVPVGALERFVVRKEREIAEQGSGA